MNEPPAAPSKTDRLVAISTETTGLSVELGHRLIEIGAIEVRARAVTGRRFHTYLNAQRPVDASAEAIHALSDDFLRGKPRFPEIAAALAAFTEGAIVVIHNAPFAIPFFDRELRTCSVDHRMLGRAVIDTVPMARTLFPGSKVSLIRLAERFFIDISDSRFQNLQGTLIDAQVTAEVYLAMTAA